MVPEQHDLALTEQHLSESSVQTRDVSRVLPDALALCADDPKLSAALAPIIQESIAVSVRRDPGSLADALFPVMGLAVRKASAATLAAMTDSLNRRVDQLFSWRALKWRLEAFRSGKPFAEILLLHTLNYRVEQLFLIHAETGLLLQHVSADSAARDADLVSAMLTAIRDFVKDSLRLGAESLERLQVGEFVVVMEQGPQAVLAAVVRGNLPPDGRVMFQDALEAIHRQQGHELRAFNGDATPFQRSRQILQTCLISEFRQSGGARPYTRLAILGTAILVASGGWLISNVRERQLWNDYLARLDAEPGIVVVSTGRRNGQFFVAGFRDPLATDPGALLDPRLRSRAASRWELYEAMGPAFAVARARRVLRPPAGVILEFQDDTLVARGPASDRWIADSEQLALALPGIRHFVHVDTTADARPKESK